MAYMILVIVRVGQFRESSAKIEYPHREQSFMYDWTVTSTYSFIGIRP